MTACDGQRRRQGSDQVVGSGLAFQSLFFVGAVLFLMTLALNMLANRLVARPEQVLRQRWPVTTSVRGHRRETPSRAALTGGKRDVAGHAVRRRPAAVPAARRCSSLFVLLWDVLAQAIPVFQKRSSGFLTERARLRAPTKPASARASGARWSSPSSRDLLPFPVGIAAGVYLEEYAKPNRLTRFIQLNIRNLAGVPSVVYGILGLVVFVQGLEPDHRRAQRHRRRVTLAILVLPIIIITTRGVDPRRAQRVARSGLRRRRARGGRPPATTCCRTRRLASSPAPCWRSPAPWARLRP